jgi:hypothetical protein
MESSKASGSIDWGYLFSGGDAGKQIVWQTVFGISSFLFRWLLIPLAIASIYYLESQEIGTWMAVLYSIYLVIHTATSPKHTMSRNALIQFIDRRKKLEDLTRIYQDSSVDLIHPKRLLDLISKAETQRVVLRPAVYSILDRAIERDGAVLAIEDAS